MTCESVVKNTIIILHKKVHTITTTKTERKKKKYMTTFNNELKLSTAFLCKIKAEKNTALDKQQAKCLARSIHILFLVSDKTFSF